ncbi:undecaprenyldiphospho-muramoylpentapeptide beta-N-acetylglucosaminyltransferase [Paenibacillus sp. N1-5-1-14]|uniref:undecaprenyldiphospho-muramoylpentapeptide beta-N-acetylglucosaminyltransferase n=1 Tax=Paenibacillus radicibacter TaxID=2972488 RepID=UPI0021595DA1|nr:undecaprenyldiphospho-muramoylpentapeptide beta-N-acetylglucosaminyltransferase [Paenibacillus radicibacter]MCR8643756.1 undecaprenyldiphospho-muramoylpentapeptide beta-N-acetylglucosaminyltransferase [Paenibacillus radicibacter]
MKRIMFTGGGSAGHVTVNLALIPHYLEQGYVVDYIGSENGIEKQLIASLPNVNYFPIATGKLRRYWSWDNFKDPFKVCKGVLQAIKIIKQRKPDLLFSKGGFVSVPVIMGAKMNKVPVIIHESDITPGLANRIATPMATAVCTTFVETVKGLKQGVNGYHVGAIMRPEIMNGDAVKGRAFAGFTSAKPILLIMGGSLGAQSINRAVREVLPLITEEFQVVHLCGKNQLDASITNPNYRQYEYIEQELPDVLAMADLVISRAGSNSIFEFCALHKPMLLIPLSAKQSRGDQILNARSFHKAGYCEVIEEENLTAGTLLKGMNDLHTNRDKYITNMRNSKQENAIEYVQDLIKRYARV